MVLVCASLKRLPYKVHLNKEACNKIMIDQPDSVEHGCRHPLGGLTTGEVEGTSVDEICCLGNRGNRESNESERLSAFPVSYLGPDNYGREQKNHQQKL